MPSWIYLVFTVAAGAMISLQQPVNAGLARHTGSYWATFVSFAAGMLISGTIALATGNAPSELGRITAAPWWQWIGGGMCGALLVLALTVSVPRIGVTALVFASLAGQIVTAMALDHFGWLGTARQPMDLRRALAIPVMLLALWLVQRPANTP
jgi:transporter family-2 protein